LHLAAVNALAAYDDAATEYQRISGRTHASVDAYGCEDAELLFVMMGSFATKAKEAVDRLREAGRPVGLVRPRLLRPFPADALRAQIAGKKAVAVIDQNLSMGLGGVLHTELGATLYGQPDMPKVVASFIAGLGGRDIRAEEFYEIAATIDRAADRGETLPPRLLYTNDELRELRKLQALARAERRELNKTTRPDGESG
jgi:pyruvate ferredoxin oxidoreductase alpha subunit